jgi:hypothetical protein
MNELIALIAGIAFGSVATWMFMDSIEDIRWWRKREDKDD